MDRSEVLVAVSLSVILGVTLLTGPAIGVVDVTQQRSTTDGLGQGNATVDQVDAPSAAQFDSGLQSESYYLEVSDARIHVTSITGSPSVTYKLSIPAMGYSRGTTHFLSEGDTGWVTLSVEQDTLPGDRIDEQSYEGELSIILRYNGTERMLHHEALTVEVTE